MANWELPLPDKVHIRGYTYILSDAPLQQGDWYIDHQKYNWVCGYPVEDCDSEGLANFINKEKRKPNYWNSKKVSDTDDPKLINAGVSSITLGPDRERFKIDMLQAFDSGCKQKIGMNAENIAESFEEWFNKKY